MAADCLNSNPIAIGPVGIPWASYLIFFCLNAPFSKIGLVTAIILNHKIIDRTKWVNICKVPGTD